MSIFARAAKAIRRLPEAKPTEHSQFFNDSAQVEIAGYKSLYAKTLKLFGEKARVPVLAAFNNVVPSGNFEAMSREDVAPSSALRAAPAA